MRSVRYIGIIVLIALSFYFTDKIMIYMENKNPIMQEINDKADLYKEAYVNAIIDGNTIIPGINGKNVNKRKSYFKMGEFGSFNETFLVYDDIKPKISLIDNKDKVIIQGNPIKREVGLIVENNTKIETLLEEQNISYTLIANLKTNLLKDHEYINGEVEFNKMSDLHTLLNKKKVNSNICLVDYSNPDFCNEKKYYLLNPTISTDTNITELLTQIKSGSIILIKSNFGVNNFNLILNEIKRQDLKIVLISKLISENN